MRFCFVIKILFVLLWCQGVYENLLKHKIVALIFFVLWFVVCY